MTLTQRNQRDKSLGSKSALSEKQHKISELDSVCGIVSAVQGGAGCKPAGLEIGNFGTALSQ